MWFAIPSSQWTLTTYSLPVSRRTPTVSGALMESLAITRDELHPQWNYTISPRKSDRAINLA
jgi:hypothetical protein